MCLRQCSRLLHKPKRWFVVMKVVIGIILAVFAVISFTDTMIIYENKSYEVHNSCKTIVHILLSLSTNASVFAMIFVSCYIIGQLKRYEP